MLMTVLANHEVYGLKKGVWFALDAEDALIGRNTAVLVKRVPLQRREAIESKGGETDLDAAGVPPHERVPALAYMGAGLRSIVRARGSPRREAREQNQREASTPAPLEEP